jgi:hypothetical protein
LSIKFWEKEGKNNRNPSTTKNNVVGDNPMNRKLTQSEMEIALNGYSPVMTPQEAAELL